eukprot:PhM_4_TR7991/c0_g1_i1/m.94653
MCEDGWQRKQREQANDNYNNCGSGTQKEDPGTAPACGDARSSNNNKQSSLFFLLFIFNTISPSSSATPRHYDYYDCFNSFNNNNFFSLFFCERETEKSVLPCVQQTRR